MKFHGREWPVFCHLVRSKALSGRPLGHTESQTVENIVQDLACLFSAEFSLLNGPGPRRA